MTDTQVRSTEMKPKDNCENGFELDVRHIVDRDCGGKTGHPFSTRDDSEKKTKTTKERFLKFGAESTVHGIRYMLNPEFLVLRRYVQFF